MFKFDEAMKALEGREEFVIKKLDGYTIINYLVTLPDSFVGIRENFRGVVFDDKGLVASLPFHKFFNVNQKEHTQASLIGHLECMVYEKFDGSMCHGLEVAGDVTLASRMGWDTEQAVAATKLMNKLGLKDAVAREVQKGWTPIFEYVGPNNPVVIQYMEEDLVYLWSRNRRDGSYGHDSTLIKGRSIVGRWMTINEVMAAVLTLEDKEGYVCVIPQSAALPDGLWAKAKCPWYMNRHRAFDMLMKPTYRIYEVGLEGKLDDLMGQCADLYKPKLEEILVEVSKDQLRLRRELQAEYNVLFRCAPQDASDHDRRKAFALAAKSNPYFSGLMSLYSGKPVDDWIKTRLFDNYKAKYPGRLFSTLPDEP